MADDDKKKSKREEAAKGGEAKAREKGAREKGGKEKGAGRKGHSAEGSSGSAQAAAPVSTTEAVPPRILDKYRQVVIPALTKQFQYKNPMQVPRLEKIVLNMGLGAAVANAKIVDTAIEELKAMGGQKPVVTRSKKAIANFKLRAGLPIGAMLTLRRTRMWEFFDRLVTVALPRTRDFKGVPRKAFDGKGNYTLGLREQIIFPEINYDRIDAVKGLNISFVTTAQTDEEGRALLQHLGMPFRAA
jgi:large subunit ribosomal protein L5